MSTRKIIITILVLALLAGGIFLIVRQYGGKTTRAGTLASKDRNLTQQQKDFYNDRITKGQEYFKTLKQDQPNFSQETSGNYVYLAQQYQGLGNLEEAKNMYNKAIEARQQNEQAWVGLAVVYDEAGKKDLAAQAYESALSASKTNSDTWIRYIEFKKQSGASREELVKQYDQALAATSGNVDILLQAGAFYEQIGDYKKALEMWQKVYTLYPGNETYEQKVKDLTEKAK